MDLNRIPSILLQTFLTVAEAGQISEAARRLHLSQPAVTGHIRRLEANLETTLFLRSANGVALTERGAHLRERVHPRIADPKLRRAIEGLKSVRDLEALPLIWRESGSGTRAVVESVLKDGGVNPRKLDQRFELGSNEAIKSLVIGGLGVGFFPFGTFNWKLRWDWSDRLTFQVFEFSGCFLGPSPAVSLEDSLVSSISSPIRSEASYLR